MAEEKEIAIDELSKEFEFAKPELEKYGLTPIEAATLLWANSTNGDLSIVNYRTDKLLRYIIQIVKNTQLKESHLKIIEKFNGLDEEYIEFGLLSLLRRVAKRNGK